MIRAAPRAHLPAGLADRPELESLVDRYRPLGDRISRDDVVAASDSLALASAAISGKVIAPFVGAPFVDDMTERERTVNTILDPDTTAAQRQRWLGRYGVDWLVLTPRDAEGLREAGAFAGGSLVPEAKTPTFVIVRVAEGRS
jgi:hypothetical protein